VGVNYLKLGCMMSWMSEPGGDVGMGYKEVKERCYVDMESESWERKTC
jgi:hypothetical protein